MTEIAETVKHEHWSSRLAFLLAAIGAAVGLGSIWKFPYTAGVGGGGAFVVVYLLAVAFLALPALVAEIMIGRRGQASPPHAMANVAREAGASSRWRWAGWLMMATVYITVSFYSVIGGCVIAYMVKSAMGQFNGADLMSVQRIYNDFMGNPAELIFWHSLFMLLNLIILSRGVRHGIESAVKIMMPLLFLLLLGLAVYSAVTGAFGEAVRFLFTPDFSALSADQILSAVGLAFFSISVGMAIMMTYGSYLSEDAPLPQLALQVAASVPVAAMIAGCCIFPIVFKYGLDPAEGPGLIFLTLPMAFSQMNFGAIFGTVFFLLVFVAALTSSISALEPMVAWAYEHKGMRRPLAAVFAALGAWTLGLVTVFSFNLWTDVRPLGAIPLFQDKDPFGVLDFLSSNLMLPLSVILIGLFAGWRLSETMLRAEVGRDAGWFFYPWLWSLRILVPVAVAIILFVGLT